jgi:hypothetical protein
LNEDDILKMILSGGSGQSTITLDNLKMSYYESYVEDNIDFLITSGVN